MPNDTPPRILTNMAFWQSETWKNRSDSIYDLSSNRDPDFMPFWRESFLLYARGTAYDVVVTMGARESLLYGLLCAATGRASRQVMTEVFIDSPKPVNFLWRVKNRLFQIVANRSIGILTNSIAEIGSIAERYHVAREQLRYVPLHSNIRHPQRYPADKGFALCAGRTLRDFDTLLRAAPYFDMPVTIVCGKADRFTTPVPENVNVLREIPREEYLRHLQCCSLVVLPLLPTGRSTGQVVMLEAMAYGKPVVTTRSPGTVDYIGDNRNGLLVDEGHAEALAAAVRRLRDDPSLAERLAAQALEDVERSFTFERHAAAKLDAIEDLFRAAASRL